MLDQNTFTETIREVSEIIRTAYEPLSREEILGYFDKMELNETQKEMVLEYLLKPQTSADSGTEEFAAFGEEESEDSAMEAEEKTVGKETSGEVNPLPNSLAFRMYLEEIEGISVCTQEELQEMYEKLLDGDEAVIGKISENWMEKILEQMKKISVASEDFSDVVQEGNMALFMKLSELCGSGAKANQGAKAESGAKANRGMAAVYVEKELIRAVEAAMKAYIQELTGEDDVENAVVGKVTLVNEARKHLMEENGQEPSVRELAGYTKMSEKELRDMLDMIRTAEERAKNRG